MSFQICVKYFFSKCYSFLIQKHLNWFSSVLNLSWFCRLTYERNSFSVNAVKYPGRLIHIGNSSFWTIRWKNLLRRVIWSLWTAVVWKTVSPTEFSLRVNYSFNNHSCLKLISSLRCFMPFIPCRINLYVSHLCLLPLLQLGLSDYLCVMFSVMY